MLSQTQAEAIECIAAVRILNHAARDACAAGTDGSYLRILFHARDTLIMRMTEEARALAFYMTCWQID